jgi:adenylate cyclase
VQLGKIHTPVLREKFKLKITKVVLLTIIWVVAGLVLSVIEMLNGSSLISENSHDSISRGVIITLVLISVSVAGIISGIFEAFISEKRFSRLHFGKLILYSSAYYLALYFGLFITGIIIYEVIMSPGKATLTGLESQVTGYFLSPHAWLSFMLFGVIVFFSLFIIRTREKFGPGTLSTFLLGKYFNPKEETRIFMFLDLKSSTSVAEKLGALKYHQFLNDFFRDITYPILYKKGEIYQYVGDEISISWTEKNGLKDLNCIECFFEVEDAIKNMAPSFEVKYGIVPEFKAALHIGKTVAGEIGIIKREIVYSGDTLNTTSRLQELCNVYGEKLIISRNLYSLLNLGDKYEIRDIGEQYLRGRTAGIWLYGIRKKNEVLSLLSGFAG